MRHFFAFSINSCEPQSIEPSGAPSPFERQNCTESTSFVNSLTSTPYLTAALKMRAPSRWTWKPRRRPSRAVRAKRSGETAMPPV